MAKPKTTSSSSFSFLFFFLTLMIITYSSSSIDTHRDPFSFIYAGCTQNKYSPNSPYHSNLDSLLSSLLNSATYSSYNNFTILLSSSDAISGLYQCRADLSMPDCSSCVSRSLARLPALCPGSCGAAIQLDACFIKYDNASFLGVQDKTLIFKKCGPSPSYGDGNTNNGHVDVEEGIMGMGSSNYKDGVLDGLAGSGGAFRVGGSGDVQGVAQCTGDLGFQECQDCIAEAIRRLRSECGDAAAYGDVFLGKCYARYSVGGAHGYSKAHEKSRKGGGEKTFAIIIGLLAGIAILVIFLAFLKRVCTGGHGK